MEVASSVRPETRRSIPTMLSPWLGATVIGGASLVVFPLLMLLGMRPITDLDYGTTVVLGILINGPHFIASYFVLYANRESALQYRSVAVFLPAVLLAYVVFAIAVWRSLPLFLNLLTFFAGVFERAMRRWLS